MIASFILIFFFLPASFAGIKLNFMVILNKYDILNEVMSLLVSFLYFQFIGLGLSSLGLIFLGHRIKKSHWLFSLLFLAGITGISYIIFGKVFPNVKSFEIFAGLPLTFGIAIIAMTEKSWNAPGQMAFVYTASSGAAFLAYACSVIFTARLGPWSLFFSLLLFLMESLAIILMIAHTLEIIDVLCRIRWMRRAEPVPIKDYFPKVSLHLPAYNEPPEMVIESLNALAALDYPNFEVLVIDNNTEDPAVWKPVEAHCRKLGFKFFHLDNWPGYKSGALNYAFKQTDPSAEIIGVVDSDYIVRPEFLRDLVGYFKNPKMAFVQTPQDYRAIDPNDRYAEACYNAYLYFFKVSMNSRNERNSIIFAGTMGLIRASILKEMGGWDEWCITEDAEISLRILSRGYESIYIDRSYGHGLMPLNFEGLKKQRFRWAFGGMQILRMHWQKLFSSSSGLTLTQKYDYLSGGIQWLNDPATLSFTLILLTSAFSLFSFQTLFIQPMLGATIYTPFAFIIFGLLRFLWALRVTLKISFPKALRAFMILLGMTWVVSLACLLGLTRKEGVFLRTPKKTGEALFLRSLRINLKEALLTLLCLLAAAGLLIRKEYSSGAVLIIGLLGWQSFIYGSAVAAGFWSYESELMAHPGYAARTSRSTGFRFGRMETDRSSFVFAAVLAMFFVFLYAQAVNNASEAELIEVLKRSAKKEPGYGLIRGKSKMEIKTRVLMEEDASLNGDVDYALALWSPDGVIVDLNNTPDNPSDDQVWEGLEAIRKRYVEEYAERKYLSLLHSDVSITIEGDEAVMINGLSAIIQTKAGVKEVNLATTDKWVFKKKGDEWKIVRLEINRMPK